MILSMTGYGKAVAEYGDKKISVEIKSLNSKTFDMTARISMLYREKEMDIRQNLSKALIRGKVDLFIWIEAKEAESEVTPINVDVLDYYYNQIKQISRQKGIPEPTEWFPTLLHLPDVLTKTENTKLDDAEWTFVLKAIEEATANLQEFRRQEGAALEKKLLEKIENIGTLLASLEPYEKERVEKVRSRIVESLKEIPEADYDSNRLEQELIYYIEKLDISEEKQRLANHLAYFKETLAGPIGQGKKLGFIAQEIGREVNTTGSKSNNAEMQNIVVEMKDELEQIKEQVLNVL